MMTPCVRIPLLALGALFAAAMSASPAVAQSTGMFGSRGPLSSGGNGGVRSSSNYTGFNTSVSNGFGTNPSFGTGGFGQSGFGGSSLGNPGFGQNGFSQGGFGQTGFGSSTMGRTSGAQGGLNSSGRTSALGGAGGTGGINGGQRGQLGQLGQLGQGLGQGLGRGGRGGGQFGNQRNGNQFNNNDSANNQQMTVRIRPQVNFQHPIRPPATTTTAISTRLDRFATRDPQFRDVQFDLADNGVVTLRGSVASEENRRLAAALVRLEPGVRRVDNQLGVAPPPPLPGPAN